MSRSRFGFTLIELLVVIGIIGLLLAMLLPTVQSARNSALRTQCLSNMHQIAVDIHARIQKSPGAVRRLQDLIGGRIPEGVGICPMDRQERERLEVNGSSYVWNRPSIKVRSPLATSKTIILFEAADNVRTDSVDPCSWFAASDTSTSRVMSAIQADIELQRHGEVSNYAYADGHVASIPLTTIQAWAARRYNFGLLNQGQHND